MRDNFSSNLSLLCSYLPSVAEVCRQIGFNRQQFNKYLSGQSRPSRTNMRRICDFFGVTDSEILLDPSQFQSLMSVRPHPSSESNLSPLLDHLNRISRKSLNLDRYIGYYYRYYYSFSNAGKIVKSLALIYKFDGKYYWKNIELAQGTYEGLKRSVNKYDGVVFLLTNRIYITEYASIEASAISQVTLYPSYHRGIGHLIGIQTGTPTRRGRRPGASRVILEYLGQKIERRKALKAIGLYDPEDREIPGGIAERIENRIPEGVYVLEVDEP